MRITGLSGSGLDIDTMVKETMKTYQIKVDQTIQKQDVAKIKQQLYRDLTTQSSDFYNKYLEISKSDSLLLAGNYKSVAFTSSDDSAITAKANSEATLNNYTVSVEQLAAKASTTLKDTVGVGDQTITFSYIDSVSTPQTIQPPITFSSGATTDETIKNYNTEVEKVKNKLKTDFGNATTDSDKKNIQAQLNALNVTAKHSDFSKGIVFTANEFGQGGFTITNSTGEAKDKYLNATITNSKGDIYKITDANNITSNTQTIDGVTFSFNDITSELDAAGKIIAGTDKPVKLTGKRDVTEIKDKIVKFVNDYNTLIKNLNTATMTKHDRNYNPLSADQKKDMKENEIKIWEEQVKKGQLYRDSDIVRITSSLKESMRTVMSDSGLNLGAIGIKPVKDYAGVNNGTFTIDEDKLTKALEENTESVTKLFTTKSLTESELNSLPSEEERIKRRSETGIFYKLRDTLKAEVMRSDSVLAKKVGIEGTASFTNNDLTRSISTYEAKINKMNKDLARREQALYSKYSNLESMMNKYNSQQSSLLSQFGTK